MSGNSTLSGLESISHLRVKPGNHRFRLRPNDAFPLDLTALNDLELQILDSRIQRQLTHECVTLGAPDAETEFRQWEIDAEVTRRSIG